jgi:hypothetical protein
MFSRGCAMQLEGSGATRGRDSGFCIMITHRATHRLLCSNSSRRKTFLTSPNNRTLRISVRVTFGFLTLPMGFKGRCFATMEDIKSNEKAELRRFLKKPSAVLPTMEQVCVCVCVCVCVRAQGSYCEEVSVSVAVCPTITVQYHHSVNFFISHRIENTAMSIRVT